MASDWTSGKDDLLLRCWAHQDCSSCQAEGPCSWCPTSSTCIPNTSAIHILAPISNAGICPLQSERWELRARPLGCHVSTITLLTCIVSVLATLTLMGLMVISIRSVHIIRTWPKGWWKVWKHYDREWWKRWKTRLLASKPTTEPERRPLLSEP
ncbi:hypothetical protein F5884DRAFT_169575 [Xylogone sp. PMI_703]|nr:hypothetical protein F5884DRAFT_169575 [Xylogone sp. PMI_703]